MVVETPPKVVGEKGVNGIERDEGEGVRHE